MFQSRSSRRGTVVALFLLIAIVGLHWLWWLFSDVGENKAEEVSPEERKEMEAFRQMVEENDRRNKYLEEHSVEMFPFNPNEADSATLLKLGFAKWQVSNILRYRRKGGVWRSAEHFSKLYGLTTEDFRRIEPYLRFGDEAKEKSVTSTGSTTQDLKKTYPEKLLAGQTVDLNLADTLMLQRVPGVGSYFSKRIVEYRESLGGYVSAEQLKEIPNFPGEALAWFTLGETAAEPERINVNKASFKTMVRHPYLNYEQVKDIVDYRRMHGRIRRWAELQLNGHFSAKDTLRLVSYFRF